MRHSVRIACLLLLLASGRAQAAALSHVLEPDAERGAISRSMMRAAKQLRQSTTKRPPFPFLALGLCNLPEASIR